MSKVKKLSVISLLSIFLIEIEYFFSFGSFCVKIEISSPSAKKVCSSTISLLFFEI